MDKSVRDNIISSYQVDGGFIVHDRLMLERVYDFLGIDPKSSLDWRIYDLEGQTHFFQNGVSALIRKLGIKRDEDVLSLGEGSGAPSRLAVKMTGCRVTGIDINPDQVIKARELAALHGIQDKVNYFIQSVEKLSLKKKDFSCAYCNETCLHWQDKIAAFKSIHGHLAPKARIGFNLWIKGDKGTLNEAYAAMTDFAPLYKPGIWFQEDLATYNRLLNDAGFIVIESADCTDKVDARMRARVKAVKQWELYGQVLGSMARESALRYYQIMLRTHYDFLRYGVLVAEKKG